MRYNGFFFGSRQVKVLHPGISESLIRKSLPTRFLCVFVLFRLFFLSDHYPFLGPTQTSYSPVLDRFSSGSTHSGR